MGKVRLWPRRPPGWSGVRWTSPTGLGLLAAFMLPVLVLAVVSIVSVRQRSETRRLLVVEQHGAVADLVTRGLDQAIETWERELLAELDAGPWDREGLLESLHAADHAFPEMRPIVMIDPSGRVIYPVRAQRSEALPALSVDLVRAALTGDDNYHWLLERGQQAELNLRDLRNAERLYRRAVGVAETPVERVRAQNALARAHLKAGEPELAAATWERMLAAADPLDPELARWNLIARIGLASSAAAAGDLATAARIRLTMLEFLTEHRFNLQPDVYDFYLRETERALVEFDLDDKQRERVSQLLTVDTELDRVDGALDLLVRQAPQLTAFEGAVVTAVNADTTGGEDPTARLASDWTLAHLNLPGDAPGSTALAIRGSSGWRLLLRWRPDTVTRVLQTLLLTDGSWRGVGVALLDSNNTVVFASTPTVPPDRVSARVDLEALPDWRIAAYPREGSIEDAALQDVLDYSVLLAAAFLAVVGGLVLATRTMSREVALARTRSDFVSNVSHELKTPLALIRMFAENLRAGWVPEPKRAEYYNVMLSESERLSAVIDNVLDFSRMESGRRDFHFRSTDLTALVSGIVERYRYSFETAGVELGAAIPEEPIVAEVDRDGIAQVLVNLLSNAAKYIGSGTKQVMVSLSGDDEEVVLVVRDTGVGMSSDSIQEIFSPFTRIDDPEVKSVAGSGIGLSIVRHIVDAHGGRIDVHSRPQAGSTFRVHLPTRHERRRQRAAPSEDSS